MLKYNDAVIQIEQCIVSLSYTEELNIGKLKSYKTYDILLQNVSNELYEFLDGKFRNTPINWCNFNIEHSNHILSISFIYRILDTTTTSLSTKLQTILQTNTEKEMIQIENMNTEIREIAVIGDYKFNNPNTDIEKAKVATLEFAKELSKVRLDKDESERTIGTLPGFLFNDYLDKIQALLKAITRIETITKVNEED